MKSIRLTRNDWSALRDLLRSASHNERDHARRQKCRSAVARLEDEFKAHSAELFFAIESPNFENLASLVGFYFARMTADQRGAAKRLTLAIQGHFMRAAPPVNEPDPELAAIAKAARDEYEREPGDEE